MQAHANTRTQRLSSTPCISLYMRLFWRSSQDTFQYLASHVCGDLGRATRLGLVHLSVRRQVYLHNQMCVTPWVPCEVSYCPLGLPLVLRSGYEWRGCPQAVSRRSHRTRNKNKQTNNKNKQTIGVWLGYHVAVYCAVFNVLWCGVVCCGIRCGVVWCDTCAVLLQCGGVCCGAVRCGAVRCGAVVVSCPVR
jgi:hypothetical protein